MNENINKETTLPENTDVNSQDKKEGVVIRLPKKVIRALVIALSVILILGGLVYYFRAYLVAAIVNNQPITRIAVIQDLEKQYGKQALDTLITKDLILQEAKKENVTVSQKDIDTQISQIESTLKQQGQTLDSALAAQNMTRADLNEQIRLQVIVEKIVGNSVQVTDQEIQDYIKQNKDYLPQDSTPEELNNQVRDQLKQQKLQTQASTWIDGLKSKSKILYFVKY